MEWILFILYAALFFKITWTNKFFQCIPRKQGIAFLSLKIIAGIAAGYIYSRNMMGGDTHTYMNDALVIHKLLPHSPLLWLQMVTGIEWQPELLQTFYQQFGTNLEKGYVLPANNSVLFVRLQAFLCLFSFGYYNVNVLFMAFLSFTGLTALYRAITNAVERTSSLTLYIIFLLPTVLFWSSMLLKESLLLFFLGWMLFYFMRMMNQNSLKSSLLFILFFILMMVFKSFIAIALLPGLAAWFISKRFQFKWITVFAIIIISSLTALAVSSQLSSSLNFFLALHNQQIVSLKFGVYYKASTLIELIPFSPDFISVYKRTPEAIYTALMRPYITEATSSLQTAAALENIITIILLIYLIIRTDIQKLKHQPIIITFISAGLFILAITAFTTPIAGTLVRLKMPGILLLLTGLSIGITGTSKQPD